MNISIISDIGVRRKENQDNYWYARLSIDNKEAGIICLCDGMGGLDNGKLASKIVVEAIREYLKTNSNFQDLSEVILQSNKTIYNLGKSSKQLMGTTCTVLMCYDGRYMIYHVGDTRCYVRHCNDVQQLTTDHSALTKYGITKENNPDMYKKYKSKLTRCLGVKENIALDYIEGIYESGDVFLVCSDGFWHFFDTGTMLDGRVDDLDNLVYNCINKGETDNITVGVLYI